MCALDFLLLLGNLEIVIKSSLTEVLNACTEFEDIFSIV